MKLSVSITPESLFQFGLKQIVARGYATAEQIEQNPKVGWSSYVQDLIREDMQANGHLPRRKQPTVVFSKRQREKSAGRH